MAVFDSGDAEGLSKLYTEECKVMPTGAPVQCGRKGERFLLQVEYRLSQ